MIRCWKNLICAWIFPVICFTAPIPLNVVDMTHPFDESTLHWPGMTDFKLTVIINGSYGNHEWLLAEDFSSGIHVGTHMDSPKHFAKNGITTEQIPFEKLVAPAAVIDISEQAAQDADYAATIEDLENWEKETGQTLNEVILLLRTGWEHRWNNWTAFAGTPVKDDFTKLHFPGLSGEAAQWLVDNRNIYGIGIDTLSFDAGNNRDAPSHHILQSRNIFGLENLDKISELPLYGAMLYVMPMKITGASGAPTRIMATFPKVKF